MKSKGKKFMSGLAVVLALAMVLSIFGAIPAGPQDSFHSTSRPATAGGIIGDSSVGTKESVTFTENGLPSGTHWSVQFGNLFASSNSSSIAFKVNDGS